MLIPGPTQQSYVAQNVLLYTSVIWLIVLVTFHVAYSIVLSINVCVVSILHINQFHEERLAWAPLSRSRFSRLDKLPLVCNFVSPLYFVLLCIAVVLYSTKMLN